MTYVVDTHSLVWFLEGDARLSSAARAALTDPSVQIVIPTMVLVEIVFLYSRHRITTALPAAFAHISAAPNCKIHPLDETVTQHIPTSLTIHDAIIVATAIVYRDVLGERTAIITKDAQIAASGVVAVIW
jgi:PIN domain nuclease of toxin-antitoxin system